MNKIHISFVIILILIILANVYFVRANYMNQLKQDRDVILIRSPADCEFLDSGDLLLFRHKDSNWVPKMIFGDEFSHSAIVYRDTRNNKLYVVEAVAEGNMAEIGDTTGGVKVSPIYARLSTYVGYICVKKLAPKMDLARRRAFDKIIERHADSKFQEPSPIKFLANCVLNIRTAHGSDTTFCSLLTTRLLVDLDLLSLNTFETCMRPQCISQLYQYANYKDGYSYGGLEELRFT